MNDADPTPPATQAADFAEALRALRAGRFGEAETRLCGILAADPGHAQAVYYLGIAAARRGAYDKAEGLFRRALTLDSQYADTHYNLGNALAALGRVEEAAASYRRAVALSPKSALAQLGLAKVLDSQGRIEEAIAGYRRALALDPNLAEAHNDLGVALAAQDRFDEAVASFDRALDIHPELAAAHNNLATALAAVGRRHDEAALAEAEIQCHRRLAADPRDATACHRLGVIAHQRGRHRAAESWLRRAVALAPDFAEAHANLGETIGDQGGFEQAVAHYKRALALKPDYVAVHNILGVMLQCYGRFAEAVIHYERALALRPDFAEAHCNLGQALGQQARLDQSLAHYQQALALKPDFAPARFGLCMGQLPILYRDAAEIGRRRAAYEAQLRALCDYVDRHPNPADLAQAVGSNQPFYLAYQGGNDRDLQSRYGSLVCRIMGGRYPPAPLPPPPAPGEPVRLGIVSGFFHHHSNWKIPIKGWLSQLDRRAFRVFGYHTGRIDDDVTKAAAALCDRFVRGPLPIGRWRQTILTDAPHILVYPEIGMHQVSLQLAAQRLARAQCNSWGHPDTSGLPTLDYFLSSALMEPADGQNHYTERLVRLPNLSIYYEPLNLRPVPLTRAELGLRATATVYWCGQAMKKFLPQFDQVFPRVAREAGDCQFVFIRSDHAALNELFSQRLEAAFSAFGLRAREYCIALPPLATPRYVAAIGQCDVFLDCMGWSGCNSTLESLPHDLPIVTFAGALMRGRHSMAILEMMGVTETIAATIEAYVSTAVRLARDLQWRGVVKRRMAQYKHRVYRDSTCISALDEFLNNVARSDSKARLQ